MAFIITADSEPVYDKLGWDDYWGCSEWIEWHKRLKEKYQDQYGDKVGLDKANEIWVKAWEHGASSLNPFSESSPVDCRTTNTAFRAYAKANGFYDGLYYGLGVLAKPLGVGGDVIDAAGNIVSTTASTADTVAKYLKWIIVGLLFAGAGLVIWWGIKRVKS